MKRDYALFQVGLKILLRKGNSFLFLEAEHWDVPGGRIDKVEVRAPFEKIIAREVREELRSRIKYRLGKPLFQFRRYAKKQRKYILLTVYDAKYISGGIKLSREHHSYQWVDPKMRPLRRKNFRSEEEYLAFREYFKYYARH